MANLSLSQLREVQMANPLEDRPGTAAYAMKHASESFPHGMGETVVPGVADCPPAELSLPLQASNPAQSATPGAGGGYCRIFPPEFASLAHVPADWKAQNWVGNGPWQNLEGWPAHPDFEANLLAVETSPEVVGLFPGC